MEGQLSGLKQELQREKEELEKEAGRSGRLEGELKTMTSNWEEEKATRAKVEVWMTENGNTEGKGVKKTRRRK